jgi:hypothetical protein
MVISADFEKQKQYFDQENIASSILLYLFIAILLVKIARLTRALKWSKLREKDKVMKNHGWDSTKICWIIVAFLAKK